MRKKQNHAPVLIGEIGFRLLMNHSRRHRDYRAQRISGRPFGRRSGDICGQPIGRAPTNSMLRDKSTRIWSTGVASYALIYLPRAPRLQESAATDAGPEISLRNFGEHSEISEDFKWIDRLCVLFKILCCCFHGCFFAETFVSRVGPLLATQREKNVCILAKQQSSSRVHYSVMQIRPEMRILNKEQK
jgi:hypothetical protein